MNHPNQLDIFAPRDHARLEVARESVSPTIDDLSRWREGDLLDMLELLCELMQSEGWQQYGTTQSLLRLANELALPSSLTTLLMATIPRLERLLMLQHVDAEDLKPSAEGMPNVAALARWAGLGGVFTRDVKAIWQDRKEHGGGIGIKEVPAVVEVQEHAASGVEMVKDSPVAAPIVLPVTAPIPVVEASQPPQLAITTVATQSGRAWKISGTIFSEVRKIDGMGHVGYLRIGGFEFQTRGYSNFDPAADQCRKFIEGVLKVLKTMPR